MNYINCGAWADGQRPATKEEFQRLVAEQPETVKFDVTSSLGPRPGAVIRANAGDIGTDILAVCGPDPYRNRAWWAAVEVNEDGKVTAS